MKKKVGNDLLNFLSGSWKSVSVEVSDGKDVKREEYAEWAIMSSDFAFIP